MYEREDIHDLFKMVECGILDLSVAEVTGEYVWRLAGFVSVYSRH